MHNVYAVEIRSSHFPGSCKLVLTKDEISEDSFCKIDKQLDNRAPKYTLSPLNTQRYMRSHMSQLA